MKEKWQKEQTKQEKAKKEDDEMIDEVEEKFGEYCSDPENFTDEACEKLF
ncbi:hypothetical protein [Metallosphaera hakonensis]|nr:hypothetical protein [Metallosphaera hakonensis]